MADQNQRVIQHEVVVNTSVEKAYNAWTTKEGMQSFFAPECEVELKMFGSYHVHFFPEKPAGQKGAEDEVILAYQKNKMISFTWGFPTILPELRASQKTSVVIYFEDLGMSKTKVTFIQSGWGEGEDWDKGYGYFEKAWKEIVFPRFVKSLETGPTDWAKK